MERGTIYNCLLTPDGGSAANDNENRPYPYKMSFATHDIMLTEYDMVYSVANDYEFDVCIGLSNADDIQGVKMRYYDYKGNPCDVDPTNQTGDVYTFSGPWKQRFSPYVKDQCPAFIITDSQGDQTFSSKLVSVQSATDAPINEGTGPDGGVFANVLDTFKGSFTIPVVNITFSLNLPLSEYIPKVSINPGGYIVIYLGSSALTNEVHKGAVNMWQSKDMKEYQRAQKSIEEDNAFASYEAKYDQAKEFYKQKKYKCLASFSLDVGIYGVVSGRWDLFDNDGEDILSKRITIKGGAGMTLTLNASWVFYPFPAVPLFYVSVSIGLSVGMAFSLSVELCWVNNAFQGWTLNALENVTIDIGVLLAFQLGVGIKDFLEGYVKGWATFDVIFSLKSKAPCTLTIVGVAGFTVGVTIFMFSTTKSFGWDPYTFYPLESIGNLLRHYMNADDDEPTDVAPSYGEPQSYPALAATAEERYYTDEIDSDGFPFKIVEANGNLFCFTIYKEWGQDGKQHSRVGCNLIDPDTGEFSKIKNVQAFIDQDTSGNHDTINQRDDYDFDVYSANDHIFILATSAREFDEDGYPVRNDMSTASYNNRDLNQIAWMIILECSPDGKLSYCENTLHCQSFQWNEHDQHVDYSYDSLGKPHISYARYYIDSNRFPHHEMYGEIGRVAYQDDPNPIGTTGVGFNFNIDTSVIGPFLMYPDKSVGSGMGDGYEFIKTCSLMDLDVSGRVDPKRASYVNMASMSFVGLSRPKDGAAGDNALELFAFGLNEADRRAIVLDQGIIGNIVAVKDLAAQEGEAAGTTVFYSLGETNEDGATQYRLCSIHIDPVTSPLTPNLEYDLTRYSYDVVLPAADFDIRTLGAVPYLYWVATTQKKQDSDPDVWRVWAMPYDSLTNSLGSPAVFSEFTLPTLTYISFDSDLVPTLYHVDNPTLHNVMLTGTGTAYVNAALSDVESIPEEDRPKRTPYSVCSIPELLTPSANTISAAPKEMVAKAGSFDDFSVSVMNDGNMAISAFDLGLYLVSDSGDEELVETAHIDALDPTKNAITMADGTVVTSGESACYRKEDYDNTSRKHDWVLDHEASAYKIHVADGKATVDKQTVEPSDPQHITTDIMMPGSAVGYTVSYKIPDDWEGGVKTLRIKVTSASTFANWPRARAPTARWLTPTPMGNWWSSNTC